MQYYSFLTWEIWDPVFLDWREKKSKEFKNKENFGENVIPSSGHSTTMYWNT